MKLFLLVTLFSSLSFGAQYTLERTNKLGYRKVTILEESKGHYIFDGKDLGTKLPPKIMKAWAAAKTPPQRQPANNCWSGTFSFVISNGQKITKRQGCSEGAAYGKRIGDLETIRDFAKRAK